MVVVVVLRQTKEFWIQTYLHIAPMPYNEDVIYICNFNKVNIYVKYLNIQQVSVLILLVSLIEVIIFEFLVHNFALLKN